MADSPQFLLFMWVMAVQSAQQWEVRQDGRLVEWPCRGKMQGMLSRRPGKDQIGVGTKNHANKEHLRC